MNKQIKLALLTLMLGSAPFATEAKNLTKVCAYTAVGTGALTLAAAAQKYVSKCNAEGTSITGSGFLFYCQNLKTQILQAQTRAEISAVEKLIGCGVLTTATLSTIAAANAGYNRIFTKNTKPDGNDKQDQKKQEEPKISSEQARKQLIIEKAKELELENNTRLLRSHFNKLKAFVQEKKAQKTQPQPTVIAPEIATALMQLEPTEADLQAQTPTVFYAKKMVELSKLVKKQQTVEEETALIQALEFLSKKQAKIAEEGLKREKATTQMQQSQAAQAANQTPFEKALSDLAQATNQGRSAEELKLLEQAVEDAKKKANKSLTNKVFDAFI